MNKLLRSISILAIVCFSSPNFGQIDVTSSPAFENNANGTINISLADAGPYDVTVLNDEGVLVCSFQSVESGSLERCLDIQAGTYAVSIVDRNNCESTYSIEVLTEACAIDVMVEFEHLSEYTSLLCGADDIFGS